MNENDKPELFMIRTTEGPEWVAAYRVGQMMVHRTHEHEGWTISHGATGYRVPAIIVTKVSALVAAEEMDKQADWSKLALGDEGPDFGGDKGAFVRAAKNGLGMIEDWISK